MVAANGGADLPIRPVTENGLIQEHGWLLVPATGPTLTDDDVRALRDGDQR